MKHLNLDEVPYANEYGRAARECWEEHESRYEAAKAICDRFDVGIHDLMKTLADSREVFEDVSIDPEDLDSFYRDILYDCCSLMFKVDNVLNKMPDTFLDD